jgi:hypothetical protein
LSEEGTYFRFLGIESSATFWYRIGQATSLPKLLLQRTPFSCIPPSLELQLDQKELQFGLKFELFHRIKVDGFKMGGSTFSLASNMKD